MTTNMPVPVTVAGAANKAAYGIRPLLLPIHVRKTYCDACLRPLVSLKMTRRAREAKLLELRELALHEEEARRAAGDAVAGVQAAQADAEKRIYALEHMLDKLLQRLPGRWE